MDTLGQALAYLLPWEFSPAWTITCFGAAGLYLRGMSVRRQQGRAVSFWRSCAFLLGVASVYVVTQTHYDYLSQFMFFTHRAQHLVLHHAAPFLIALAVPWSVLAAGLPVRSRHWLPSARPRLWRGPMRLYRGLQQPLVAAVLFVGLIYYWLIPSVHFDAMLSRERYEVMNWSMLLDGLLFWWLMLDPRPETEGGLGYGKRLLILAAVMVPQIFLGAFITFSDRVLFDVYEVCGRAWPLAPIEDQQLGGLLTWIPPAMMSGLGSLVVMHHLLRNSGNVRTEAGAALRSHAG